MKLHEIAADRPLLVSMISKALKDAYSSKKAGGDKRFYLKDDELFDDPAQISGYDWQERRGLALIVQDYKRGMAREILYGPTELSHFKLKKDGDDWMLHVTLPAPILAQPARP
jgi:hypothetical protein